MTRMIGWVFACSCALLMAMSAAGLVSGTAWASMSGHADLRTAPAPPGLGPVFWHWDIQFVSPTVGWLTGGDYVFKTSDGCKSWERQLRVTWPGLPEEMIGDLNNDLVFHSASVGWIASQLQGLQKLWTTRDGGETWRELPDPPGYFRQLVAGSADVLWAIVTQGDQASGFRVIRSADGGTSWRVCRRWSDPVAWAGLGPRSIAALGASRAIVSSGSSILRTGDGGRHWQKTTLQIGRITSTSSVSSSRAWAVTSLGIARTATAGRTWRLLLRRKGLDHVQFIDAQHGWATDRDRGVILRTANGGKTWGQVTRSRWFRQNCVFSFVNPRVGFATADGPPVLWSTTNGGRIWDVGLGYGE